MIVRHRVWRQARAQHIPVTAQRWLSSTALERPVQSYISTSKDPYVNLSIEHHILQKSSPDSAVLFLYVNRPSIIIGRNQNPWLEVNLALLNQSRHRPETEPPALGAVDLVRRRSGGGTVFHDEGNVNWTVICPSAKFTRDTHAEMVTRALRDCGITRARVNERHDIVLDQGERINSSDPDDTHTTPYTNKEARALRPLKVSGSAYKLTRNRALHHGTCLLSSPNLNVIPDYLHSPAKPFMTARGVESVSSPVGNILLTNEVFIDAVQQAFAKQYVNGQTIESEPLDDDLLDIDPIAKGCDELKSLEWTYLQTPQFTLSNSSDEMAPVDLELTARKGVITEGSISPRTHSPFWKLKLDDDLLGQELHQIESWEDVMDSSIRNLGSKDREYVVHWLQCMLPIKSWAF